MAMGGPPAKKMKPEEQLIPEQTFLRQNPPTVTFQVSAPKVEKDDWNCKGQLITISMPLKDRGRKLYRLCASLSIRQKFRK